jgi:ethanolamine-phosphate phospho-lyase
VGSFVAYRVNPPPPPPPPPKGGAPHRTRTPPRTRPRPPFLCSFQARYLSPYLTEYARRITATMPDPLRVCFWVNSGSEANDLALRLARAHTRKRGVMCVEGAYHGHVTTIIDISPYKYAREGGAGRRAWVREAPAPDVFSGKHRGKQDDDAMGAAYAAEVDTLLEDFAAAEKREATRRERVAKRRAEVAAKTAAAGSGAAALAEDDDLLDWDDDGLTAGCSAFIMESILSCGGQILPPPGYLRRVYKSVRAAGGVTIADEVQVRVGGGGGGDVGDLCPPPPASPPVRLAGGLRPRRVQVLGLPAAG